MAASNSYPTRPPRAILSRSAKWHVLLTGGPAGPGGKRRHAWEDATIWIYNIYIYICIIYYIYIFVLFRMYNLNQHSILMYMVCVAVIVVIVVVLIYVAIMIDDLNLPLFLLTLF